ncbi:hypothetical protein J2802_006333, partial [Paraburkholderia caribensis]|nr:hypothetical protein [Paraburkholderia caribensis]
HSKSLTKDLRWVFQPSQTFLNFFRVRLDYFRYQ